MTSQLTSVTFQAIAFVQLFYCTLSLLKYVLEKHHLNTIIALHAFIYSFKYLHTFLKFPVFRCLVLSYRP